MQDLEIFIFLGANSAVRFNLLFFKEKNKRISTSIRAKPQTGANDDLRDSTLIYSNLHNSFFPKMDVLQFL